MKVSFKFGRRDIEIEVPDGSITYISQYHKTNINEQKLLEASLFNLIGSTNLNHAIKNKREGKVIIVVSDITRSIP